MSDTEVKENENKQEQLSKKDVEQLEMLAFHFTQVCKRLSQDREHWAETGKDLARAVNNLNETLHKFAQLEKKVAEQVAVVLTQGSHNAAKDIASSIGEKTKQVLTEQIKVVTDHLNKTVREASETLVSYNWQISNLKKWFLIGIVISSLIGNILAGVGVYYFLANKENNNAIAIIEEIRAMESKEKTPAATHRPRVQHSNR